MGFGLLTELSNEIYSLSSTLLLLFLRSHLGFTKTVVYCKIALLSDNS